MMTPRQAVAADAPEAAANVPEVLTVDESAGRAKVSRSTIENAMRAGELKFRKRGRRILILFPDLLSWIKGE